MIWQIILPIAFFLFGVIFASFSNMLMYRLSENKPIFKESHSYCPKCGAYIKWYDNIPIISYIFLKGKCRNCHEPISIRYILVELFGGIIFLSTYYLWMYVNTNFDYQFSLDPIKIVNGVSVSFILLFLLISAYVDKKSFIAPLSCSIVMFIFAVTKYIVYCSITKDYGLVYLLGFGVPLVLLLLIYFIGVFVLKVEPIGLGDVIIFSILGLAFGGYMLILLVFLSSFICSVVEIIKIKKTHKRDKIPFVPYIFIGALLTAYVGPITIKGISILLGGH